MIPHTVPNSPTNGATAPDRREDVEPVGELVGLVRHRRSHRGRQPFAHAVAIDDPASGRSPPFGDARGEHLGDRQARYRPRACRRRRYRRPSRNRSRTCAIALRVRPSRPADPMMIAQVQMLAISSPAITICTTISAWSSNASGEVEFGERSKLQCIRSIIPRSRSVSRMPPPTPRVAASAARRGRPAPPSPPLRPVFRHRA